MQRPDRAVRVKFPESVRLLLPRLRVPFQHRRLLRAPLHDLHQPPPDPRLRYAHLVKELLLQLPPVLNDARHFERLRGRRGRALRAVPRGDGGVRSVSAPEILLHELLLPRRDISCHVSPSSHRPVRRIEIPAQLIDPAHRHARLAARRLRRFVFQENGDEGTPLGLPCRCALYRFPDLVLRRRRQISVRLQESMHDPLLPYRPAALHRPEFQRRITSVFAAAPPIFVLTERAETRAPLPFLSFSLRT